MFHQGAECLLGVDQGVDSSMAGSSSFWTKDPYSRARSGEEGGPGELAILMASEKTLHLHLANKRRGV